MSYPNPINPTLSLKGIDKKIQAIQLLMNMTWLTKSFGLADRIVELRGDKNYIYPATFEGNSRDPIPMMPGDMWDAFCFWTKTNDAEFDFADNFPPKNPLIKHKVSCIFYIDIKKVDATTSYKETKSKIREDIFHFFNNVRIDGMLVATRFTDDDITEVYKGFSIDQVDNKFMMYPKWACKMDFEISFRDACYTTNTYL